MNYMLEKIKSKKKFLFLILCILFYAVFTDELTDTFLINGSSRILNSSKGFRDSLLVCVMLFTQIIFSPIQAGFSDYYLRRKSLMFSLILSLFAVVIFISSNYLGSTALFIAIIIKGALGNTVPIAWAGISDITKGKNIRFALALSICALAVGSWGSLILAPLITVNAFFILTFILLIICLFLLILGFKDPKDSLTHNYLEKVSFYKMISHEFIGIYRILKKPINFYIVIAFFFSEIAFYQILFRVEVFKNYHCFINIPLTIGIGYTLGTIWLKFLKSKDKVVSLMGLVFSFLSILMISLLFLFEIENKLIFNLLFVFYSFGYALFTPALYSLITLRDHPHLQGKIYGLLESTDSLASLITFLGVFLTASLACTSIMVLSTIFLIFCSIFYKIIFKKCSIEQLDH